MSIHDADAERAVLGCVLAGESPEVARVLAPGDFFVGKHRWVWEAMLALLAAGEPIDEVTVIDRLKAAGKLADVGGPAWLMGLTATAPLANNLGAYVAIVRDRTLRRALVDSARVVSQLALSLDANPQAVALKGSGEMAQLGAAGATELPTLEKAFGELMDDLDAIAKGTKVGALPTGIDVWDELLGGLQLGRLTCIGAPPSVGKSALKNRMIINLARAGVKVGTFELEDPISALVRRAVSKESGIPVRRLASEPLPDFLLASVGAAIEREYRWAPNVIYAERSGMTDAQVAATARQMVVQRGCKAIFIDNASELAWTSKLGRLDADIEAGLRMLRDVGKDLNVAVVLLVHFHRPKGQTDADPCFQKPTSSMWKNSGGFEQMARVAVGLYQSKDMPGAVLATVTKQTEGERYFDFAMPMHKPSGLIESEGGRKQEDAQGYSEGAAP